MRAGHDATMPNRWASSFSTVLDLSIQEIIFTTNILLVDCMLEQGGLVAGRPGS
jgi:hypothetical protein